MPPRPTVSTWALSMRLCPPPDPGMRPRAFGRPTAASSVQASIPVLRSHSATKVEIASSPAPPGTSDGLTDSMATKLVSRSTTEAVLTIPGPPSCGRPRTQGVSQICLDVWWPVAGSPHGLENLSRRPTVGVQIGLREQDEHDALQIGSRVDVIAHRGQ